MDDLTHSPDPDGTVNLVGHGQIPTLKIFGMEIPLPPWAVSAVAVVGIIAVAAAIALAIMHYHDDREANDKFKAQSELLEQREAELEKKKKDWNLTKAEYKEWSIHQQEPPELRSFTNHKLLVAFYSSDGCVWVTRKTPGGSISKWFPGPSKTSPAPASIPEVGKSRSSLEPGMRMVRSESPALAQAFAQPIAFSTASVRLGGQMALAQPVDPCRGSCQNPHPGRFESSEGERRGCWVQVWRKWPDGCTHYQWFNTCNSYWDSDERGRPRVNWTCCNH